MSSTYSTNLRTELIGSGDQAGTWGTTTNTSLGTILEQAIAGVSGGPYVSGTYPTVNFPTDADITLTANNGSVDQSRSMVLVVTSTGSLTATRNVIAPASASKVYIIKNSTTGGQSIQIKYATGTAVLVPNGQTVPVYGDGSNFYTAVTNTVPAGSIQMWATATAPSGYVICNGTAISRTTYSTLFGVIGTTFGVGDGSTTFNVPDYTNRMPYGTTVGATGGAATTTIATTNLPSHTHTFSGTTGGQSADHAHSISDPGHAHNLNFADGATALYGQAIGGSHPYTAGFTGGAQVTILYGNTTSVSTGIGILGTSNDHNHSFTGTTGGTGSGTAISTISPYLGINFIIKT
jgi:microcystin-dependent protein